MKNLKNQKTLNTLIEKATLNHNKRMPSITKINDLLNEIGVKTSIRESLNVVEYRTGARSYVNSRHDGKVGKKMSVETTLKNGERFGEY